MDLFVYTFEPLRHGLDDLEQAIDEALQGRGEVTGTGTGGKGSNIDVEITDQNMTPAHALSLIRSALGVICASQVHHHQNRGAMNTDLSPIDAC